MSFENEIKDTLARRAGDVTPDRGALGEIERGVTRARKRRAIGVGLTAVVIVALGAVGATRLLSTNEPGGFVDPGESEQPSVEPTPTPSPSSSSSPSVPPPPDKKPYLDERGFAVSYPDDWSQFNFEGHAEFVPPGLSSPAKGDDTFFVDIWVDGGPPKEPERGCEGEVGKSVIAGYDADWCFLEGDGVHIKTYTTFWDDRPCAHVSLACPDPEGITLTLIVRGETDTLWNEHQADGEAIVASVQAVDPPEGPASEASARKVAEAFLAARVRGSGAERYMTAYAKQNMTDLYRDSNMSKDYTGYEVTRIDAADANSFEVQITLEFDETSGVTETLFVGPDEGEIKIRGHARGGYYTA